MHGSSSPRIAAGSAGPALATYKRREIGFAEQLLSVREFPHMGLSPWLVWTWGSGSFCCWGSGCLPALGASSRAKAGMQHLAFRLTAEGGMGFGQGSVLGSWGVQKSNPGLLPMTRGGVGSRGTFLLLCDVFLVFGGSYTAEIRQGPVWGFPAAFPLLFVIFEVTAVVCCDFLTPQCMTPSEHARQESVFARWLASEPSPLLRTPPLHLRFGFSLGRTSDGELSNVKSEHILLFLIT